MGNVGSAEAAGLGSRQGWRRLEPLVVLAPFLLATFPVVFLAAENTGEDIGAFEVIAPLFVIWAGVAVLVLLLRLWLKSTPKAAMAAVMVVVAFFGYGVLHDAVREFSIADITPFRHRTLIPATFLATAIGVWLVATRSWAWSRPLTWISLASLLLVAFNVVRFAAAAGPVSLSPPPDLASVMSERASRSQELPDIYFMILDGYGRADVLEKQYGFDNSDFIAALEARGFQTVPDAHTNYVYTEHSVKTTLNMRHIYDMERADIRLFLRAHDKVRAKNVSIDSTAVARLAISLGYRTAAINSRNPDNFDRRFNLTGALFSPLSELLLGTTALTINKSAFLPLWRIAYGPHNFPARIPDVAGLADDPAPTFAYFHAEPPHPPYIFERDGSLKPAVEAVSLGNIWVPKDGYIDQVVYVNSVILDLVNEILQRSASDPIIIIQGDHGPSSVTGTTDISDVANPSDDLIAERMSILNVMHLPEMCTERPYAGMTSVNTFRFLFNSCFETSFDYLRDTSFYNYGHGHQLDFQPVWP